MIKGKVSGRIEETEIGIDTRSDILLGIFIYELNPQSISYLVYSSTGLMAVIINFPY